MTASDNARPDSPYTSPRRLFFHHLLLFHLPPSSTPTPKALAGQHRHPVLCLFQSAERGLSRAPETLASKCLTYSVVVHFGRAHNWEPQARWKSRQFTFVGNKPSHARRRPSPQYPPLPALHIRLSASRLGQIPSWSNAWTDTCNPQRHEEPSSVPLKLLHCRSASAKA